MIGDQPAATHGRCRWEWVLGPTIGERARGNRPSHRGVEVVSGPIGERCRGDRAIATQRSESSCRSP